VTLVEYYQDIGGVCLNVGCIPSKALLHVAGILEETKEMDAVGISFGKPKIDIDKIRAWKNQVISRLTGGLKALAKQRKVEIVQGYGKFKTANSLTVEKPDGTIVDIQFKDAVIAA